MEENQLSQNAAVTKQEPLSVNDNSNVNEQKAENQKGFEEKSSDPSNLILGKFKSTEDLTEAYKQLEKLQGNQSSELGMLREKVSLMDSSNEMIKTLQNVIANQSQIQETAKKYSEYFEDPSFRELYKDAYCVLGSDLDVDRLVNLVESYVSARIFAHEKSKAAESETLKARGDMKFDKNDKVASTPVKKSIQQMTPKELDEMLEKLI